MFTRTYAISPVKRNNFYRKSELQMFLLISGGHIGGPKRYINEWNLCQMQHRLFLMDFSRKVSERFWFWCLLCYLVSFVVILTVLVLKIKSIKLLSVNAKRPKSPATSTWQPHVSSSGKILTNIHEIKSCGLQFDRTKWDWYSQSILKFNLDTGEREVNGCKATNCTLRNYVKLVGIGN